MKTPTDLVYILFSILFDINVILREDLLCPLLQTLTTLFYDVYV